MKLRDKYFCGNISEVSIAELVGVKVSSNNPDSIRALEEEVDKLTQLVAFLFSQLPEEVAYEQLQNWRYEKP